MMSKKYYLIEVFDGDYYSGSNYIEDELYKTYEQAEQIIFERGFTNVTETPCGKNYQPPRIDNTKACSDCWAKEKPRNCDGCEWDDPNQYNEVVYWIKELEVVDG